MPNLKGGESSRKRERSPNPSADAPDAPERDNKRIKIGSHNNGKRRQGKKSRKKRRREKKRQAAAAAQREEAKSAGQKEPALAQREGGKSAGQKEPAAPVGRKKSFGQSLQRPSNLDPAENVKQQVARGLQRHPTKIKQPVDHTGVEIISHHSPHKMKSEGYVFVPAGSKYITLNCRRLTLLSGRNVWKIDHPKGKGIQVPKEIYEVVIANEAATRAQRGTIVAKIDQKENDEALKCLIKLFPNLPPGASGEILGRAWQKSSGRVGRTKKLTMEQKVRLAVVAHVRHCHTSYEKRLQDEANKNGGQRAPAKAVQKIRSQIWGEVNAVVKHWQKTGTQVAQAAKPVIGGRVVPQHNIRREPDSPKTKWQQNVEQGFVITHPPKKMEASTNINQRKRLKVIVIDSDSEEDTAGVDISKVINLGDVVGGDDEIMEGNHNDWDAAVGNAQDWDIGEDDEESDIDEDYMESDRGSGLDAYEDDYEEPCSVHYMEQDEPEDDDDENVSEAEEPMEGDGAFSTKRGEIILMKQESDQTAFTSAGFLSTTLEKPAGEAVSQANFGGNSDKVLPDPEKIKAREEIGETISTPALVEITIPENKTPITVPDLRTTAVDTLGDISPSLEDAEAANEKTGTVILEPARIENTVSKDKASMKEPHVENSLVGYPDEMILDLEDTKAVKEEDEIMADSIALTDIQPCPVPRALESGAEADEAKQPVREEESIRSVLEKAAIMSGEEEADTRAAVEADEDEIYHDFGF